MNGPAISMQGITKVFQSKAERVEALRGITLEIDAGSLVIVAGPSGSGKTTLLNLMGGLDRPTAGTIMSGGTDLGSLDEHGLALYRRSAVGFVFQAGNLIPGLSALENVELPLFLSGMGKERQERAMGMLEHVGLAQRANTAPSNLSGGEQQRVALARALVHSPKLLLADEPTANLDSHTAESIFELIMELNARLGTTIVLATHDPSLLARVPRVLRLRDGRIEPE